MCCGGGVCGGGGGGGGGGTVWLVVATEAAGGFDLGMQWFGKGANMEAVILDVTICRLDDS